MFVGTDAPAPTIPAEAGFSDDLQLALYLAYEIHYSDHKFLVEHEWDGRLIDFRVRLESAFEEELLERTQEFDTQDVMGNHTVDMSDLHQSGAPNPSAVGAGSIDEHQSAFTSLDSSLNEHAIEPPVSEQLLAVMELDNEPSYSEFMEHQGTFEDFQRYLKHRSLYQLKEADPHTLGIPHSTGLAKQWLMKIQAGEYGVDGDGRVMHSSLFGETLADSGLRSAQNVYLNEVSCCAFVLSNVVSLFGLNRRLTPALFGHLAAVEVTSVGPMRRYLHAAQRHGLSKEAQQFFKVHTLADVEHEKWALEMVDQLTTQDPHAAEVILFGAKSELVAEQFFTHQLHPRYDSVLTA